MAKANHFKAALDQKRIDSLKLNAMLQKLNEAGTWGEKEIKAHGEEMINVLLESTQSQFQLN